MNQLSKVKQASNAVKVKPMSKEVAEVRRNINMVQEAMQATMKKDTHYGVIPGCGKPSLYKAGAEILIALFKLTFTPTVKDLSTDGEIRYMVTMELSTRDGMLIGSGIGECSSQEEKYMWRASLCDREFEVTPEHLKRIKFKKNYGKVDEIKQIRVNPSDMANTILKMAKKRALIDGVLTATGASDIFTQDTQDLPEGIFPEDEPRTQENQETVPTPEKTEKIDSEPTTTQKTGNIISEPQRKRLFAIAMGAGMDKDEFKEWLFFNFNYESSKDILKSDYEKICSEAEKYQA